MRNRQPGTYLAWFLMITIRRIILYIGYQIKYQSYLDSHVLLSALMASDCIAKVLLFKRISVLVYSCFVQNWLCDLDMLDFQAVESLRLSVSLSSIAVNNRGTIAKIMWVAFVIMSLFYLAIFIWNVHDYYYDGSLALDVFQNQLLWLLWPCCSTG